MIADLDRVIRQLMLNEMHINNGEIDIEFDQPKREWSARLLRPTVNFFLYDLRENPQLRQHHWEAVSQNPASTNRIVQKRTPYRYDLYYMLTTWVPNQPEDEHRLLARCMLALGKHPIIEGERLKETALANPVFELRTRLASHDVLTNAAELWGALDNELRPSVSYVVTLTFDPWQPVEGPAVISVSFKSGQEGHPEQLQNRRLSADSVSVSRSTIGGVVYSKSDRKPLADVEVEISGTGLYARTDEHGRYRVSGLRSGNYSLIARSSTQSSDPKQVNVPNRKDENYDLEV